MKLKKTIDYGFKILKAHVLRERYPLVVKFKLTYKCNFRCNYCYDWQKKEKELPTKDIKKIINDLADMGCINLTLSGGEPLLRKDIGDIISYSKGRGLFTSLNSNGYLVDKFIDKLKKLDLLVLSLDGPKEMHDKNRMMKGSYDKIIEAIRIAKENGIKVCTISVLTKNNAPYIDSVLNMAEKMGFITIFQPAFYNESSPSAVRDVLADKEVIKKTFRKLVVRKKEGAPISNSIAYLDYFAKNWSSPSVKFTCWASKLFCVISPRGNIFPCAGVVNRIKSFNAVELGFRKAFEKTPIMKCSKCWYNCYLEHNLLFSLNPKSIINILKNKDWL